MPREDRLRAGDYRYGATGQHYEIFLDRANDPPIFRAEGSRLEVGHISGTSFEETTVALERHLNALHTLAWEPVIRVNATRGAQLEFDPRDGLTQGGLHLQAVRMWLGTVCDTGDLNDSDIWRVLAPYGRQTQQATSASGAFEPVFELAYDAARGVDLRYSPLFGSSLFLVNGSYLHLAVVIMKRPRAGCAA